jgi:membrane-associated phospholipid phosphatase
MGVNALYQRIASPPAGGDHLTAWDGWLAMQNGIRPDLGAQPRSAARYMITGRDMAAWTRHDYPAQAGMHAALVLDALRAPVQSGHPYVQAGNQTGYVTFGAAQVTDLVARVAMHALRAAWFHKWVVHRRLRPEAFGGRVEGAVSGSQVIVLPHGRFLHSQALAEVRRMYGTALLPQAYPEGAPLHPAYPAAHAAVVGASVTVLKAYYAESWILPSPVTVSADGRLLEPLQEQLTVGGELNKLASNVAMGRVFAGVQWRSDVMAGLHLGEQVALSLLRELKGTQVESAGVFQVTRFNGTVEEV